MENKIIKFESPYIFRYRNDVTRTLEEIENQYIFFSTRDKLNDEDDSDPKNINFQKSKIDKRKLYSHYLKAMQDERTKNTFAKEHDEDSFIDFYEESISSYIYFHGIACFSKMPYTNKKIWDGYANYNKGVCLQFDFTLDKEFFYKLDHMKYSPEIKPIDFNPLDSGNAIMDVFYHKKDTWDYEHELRLVKFNKGNRKVHYNEKTLVNIVCGYNCENDYVTKITDVAKKYNPKVGVFKMEKPENINKARLIPKNDSAIEQATKN